MFAAQIIIIAQDWQLLSTSIPRGHKITTRLPHSHPVLIFRKECLWPLLQSSNLSRRRILELHASLTMSMPRSVPRLVAAPPVGRATWTGVGNGYWNLTLSNRWFFSSFADMLLGLFTTPLGSKLVKLKSGATEDQEAETQAGEPRVFGHKRDVPMSHSGNTLREGARQVHLLGVIL